MDTVYVFLRAPFFLKPPDFRLTKEEKFRFPALTHVLLLGASFPPNVFLPNSLVQCHLVRKIYSAL